MNTAEKYVAKKMQSTDFKKAYLEEKTKLDLEILLDGLIEKINAEVAYSVILNDVRAIKHTLAEA